MNPYILTSRPKQLIKNLLVFIVPILAFEINLNNLLLLCNAFISFCMVSSAVYFLNDANDIQSDRLHPLKKSRPIASGQIKIRNAIFVSVLLFFFSYSLSFLISLKLFLIVFTYSIIQILYCFSFKNKPLLDIFCISSGFLLRAFAGGVSDDIYVSPWFILTVGLGSLILAIEKRKAELKRYLDKGVLTRKVLLDYSLRMLEKFENIVSTSTFIFYSLWAAGPELNGSESSLMLITIPFVLFGIFRYQYLSNLQDSPNKKFSFEKPEDIFYKDKPTQINLFIWFSISLIIFLITR